MIRTIPDHAPVVLEGHDLTVVLGGQGVLDVPRFSVREGEAMMIIGPNGSGKTTLLLTLALLLKPASGAVLYRGRPVVGTDLVLHQRRKLAVVFQEPLLLNSSVMDNVTLGLKLRGVARHEIKRRAEKWLERFGIAGLAKRQARLLFMGLDTPTRRGLLEDFESVLEETHTTVLMVTHDRDEALALGDRVAVLMDGAVRMTGSPDEIFGKPVDRQVAAFVEAGNVLRGVILRHDDGLAVIDLDGRQLRAVSDLPAGSEVMAYLRYDDVTVMTAEDPEVSSRTANVVSGEITRKGTVGWQVKLYLDCGFPLVALMTKRDWEADGLEIGQTVTAIFQPSALHVIPKDSEPG